MKALDRLSKWVIYLTIVLVGVLLAWPLSFSYLLFNFADSIDSEYPSLSVLTGILSVVVGVLGGAFWLLFLTGHYSG